jgi:hypothetical protein
MPTIKIKVPTLSKAVLAAALEARKALSADEGGPNNRVPYTGRLRKIVLTAAIQATTPQARKSLAAASGEALHHWIGAILSHAGCLRVNKAGYIDTITAMVNDTALGFSWDDASASMPGPAHIKRALAKFEKLAEKDASVDKSDEKAAKPKPPKKTKAKKATKRPPRRKKEETKEDEETEK